MSAEVVTVEVDGVSVRLREEHAHALRETDNVDGRRGG